MKPGYRVALVIFITSVILFSAIPREVDAMPYKVEGYLKNAQGNPIPLANISISGELYDMGVQDLVPVTYYRSTDAYGHYEIWLAANEPGGFYMDATITLSYCSGKDITTTTTKIEGLSTWANLTYSEKPSLGDLITSPVGVLSIVIIVSACFIGYFIFKSEPSKEEPDKSPARVERRRRQK